jgi:hypothetical protein
MVSELATGWDREIMMVRAVGIEPTLLSEPDFEWDEAPAII